MSPPTGGAELGQLLLQAGAIDELRLRSALGHQRQWGGRLGRILVELKFLDELTLAKTLAGQLGLDCVRITLASVELEALSLVPQPLAERYWIFPLRLSPEEAGGEGELTVAVADPTHAAALEDVRFNARKRLKVVVAPEGDVEAAIRRFYYGDASAELPAPEPAEPRPAAPLAVVAPLAIAREAAPPPPAAPAPLLLVTRVEAPIAAQAVPPPQAPAPLLLVTQVEGPHAEVTSPAIRVAPEELPFLVEPEPTHPTVAMAPAPALAEVPFLGEGEAELVDLEPLPNEPAPPDPFGDFFTDPSPGEAAPSEPTLPRGIAAMELAPVFEVSSGDLAADPVEEAAPVESVLPMRLEPEEPGAMAPRRPVSGEAQAEPQAEPAAPVEDGELLAALVRLLEAKGIVTLAELRAESQRR